MHVKVLVAHVALVVLVVLVAWKQIQMITLVNVKVTRNHTFKKLQVTPLNLLWSRPHYYAFTHNAHNNCQTLAMGVASHVSC
jgi:hypothetical protein